MWPKVCEHFGIEATALDINMRQYRLKVHEEYDEARIFKGEMARLGSLKIGSQRPPFDSKNPFMAEIIVNRELYKGGDRNCMHVEVNIEGSRIKYDAGDHIAIYPCNDSALVDRLCELLGVSPDTVISLTNIDEDSSKKVPFPCPCTYRTALSHYVDICSLPRTHVLKEFIEYTSDNKEKEKLSLMAKSSEEGKAEYQKWIVNECRSIIHILEDLPSCRPPLDYVCELMPRLQARMYSISSSSKLFPTSIHVTANVLEYETQTGRKNKGVCTNWLFAQKVHQDTKLYAPIYVRKSQFRLPNKTHIPVIMVGPGTGLAPFRGFVQEKKHQKDEGKSMGEVVLYYGCRNKDMDFMYEEELQSYVDEGVMKMYVAFSRDQEKKSYVTHLLEENRADVWRILGQENGHFYVCGDAKRMARDVNEIIINIAETEGKMSRSEAESYVKKLMSQKRYSADVWS